MTREDALSFESFWDGWPNKVGKPAALKAFRSAIKRNAPLEAILSGVENYVRDKPPDRPWLNPATFLNQSRWEDQPATVSPHAKPKSAIIQAAADLRRTIASFDGPASADFELCDGESSTSLRLISNG